MSKREWSEVKFQERVDKELQSMYQPRYKDNPADATMEDLIRDLYRVVAGNGGSGRSIMMKVASTNAHIESLRDHIIDLEDSTETQTRRCNERHPGAKPDANSGSDTGDEVKAATALFRFVIRHRRIISIVIGAGILYISNIVTATMIADRKEGAIVEQAEQRINAQIMKTLKEWASEAGNGKTSDDTRPAPRK